MSHLKFLNLNETNVSDQGIGCVGTLRNLTYLGLRNTRVTEKTAKELEAKLPDCTIGWGE